MVWDMARPAGHELNRDAWDDVLRMLDMALPEVAQISGVPAPSLRSLRGGFHKASAVQACRIADACGCRPGTLFPSLRQSEVAA
jgi:hypothetical protein